MRRARGLTGTDLARRAGMSQSKVSKIETAKAGPTREDVEALARGLDLTEQERERLADEAERLHSQVTSYRVLLRAGLGAGQEDLLQQERATREIRALLLTVVPGLLQTAGYAYWLFNAFDERGREDIPRAVAGRLARQEALFDPARRFVFLIHESVLRLRYGPDSLLPQLDRIASISTLENVEVGIIPFSAELPRPLPPSFQLYDDALVIVELLTSEVTIRDPEQVAVYRRHHDLFASAALFGDEGRALIEAIGREQWRR